MSKLLYTIDRWNDLYECAQSRKISGVLHWVATPTSHDGNGYKRVMRLPDGPLVYAAWMLIVQVAAKCPKRGVLADSRGPLDAEDLAMKTDCPQELFERAFKVLAEPKIGWLVVEEWERSGSGLPTQYPTVPDSTQQDTTLPACAGEDEPAEAEGQSRLPKHLTEIADEILTAWNASEGLRPARAFTRKRYRALKARLSDPLWRDQWRDALARAPACEYLTGKGSSGWRADLDFFLRPDSVNSIMEGKYDHAKRPGSRHPSEPGPGQRYDPAATPSGVF